MKVVFLITLMFVLVVVHGWNPHPCMPNGKNNTYKNFVHRHILQQNFDTNSEEEWSNYLQQNGLCNRTSLQTFLEKKDQRQVEQICQGHGRRYNWYDNLCISNSPIWIYDLTVDTNNCQITRLARRSKYVVVACDAIANVCLPVQFEKSTSIPPVAPYGRCR